MRVVFSQANACSATSYLFPPVLKVKVSVLCENKAIPLLVWTDPEGSRRLRLPDFMTVGT